MDLVTTDILHWFCFHCEKILFLCTLLLLEVGHREEGDKIKNVKNTFYMHTNRVVFLLVWSSRNITGLVI